MKEEQEALRAKKRTQAISCAVTEITREDEEVLENSKRTTTATEKSVAEDPAVNPCAIADGEDHLFTRLLPIVHEDNVNNKVIFL